MTELHLSSPAMTGTAVLAVQSQLAAAGFPPGARDGIYGPATAAAVTAFQRAHGMTATGVVNPVTLAKLASPGAVKSPAPWKPGANVGHSAGRAALAEAIKHIGVKESPPESNRTPFGKWFGVDGVPWCNIFVSYCFKVGAGYTICSGFKGAGAYPGKGSTYVPTTEAWLRSAGLWVGRTTPQPGDIAIFNWDGGVPDHIGIVESWQGPKDGFTTIEGNTAVGNDSNGGEVMRRTRVLANVDGFGRVI